MKYPIDIDFRVLFHRFKATLILAKDRLKYFSPLKLINKCNQNTANNET